MQIQNTMRKLLLIPTLFLVLRVAHGQTNVYHPFPDSNAIWNVEADAYYGGQCPPPPSTNPVLVDYTFSEFLQGDTTINNYIYHKIYMSGYVHEHCQFGNFVNNWNYFNNVYEGAYRQDTLLKKIFFYYSNTEWLLYDFNLNVGDTLFGYQRCGEVVSSIDSVLIGNNYRKRFNLSNTFTPHSIIEGIGSTAGLLGQHCSFEYFSYLTCFVQNGQTLYPDTITNCQLITQVKEVKFTAPFSISPNPFSTHATLQTDKLFTNATLTIYNSFGQQVKQLKNISGNTITLHRDNLPGGLYFLRMTQEDQTFTAEKLVITDN